MRGLLTGGAMHWPAAFFVSVARGFAIILCQSADKLPHSHTLNLFAPVEDRISGRFQSPKCRVANSGAFPGIAKKIADRLNGTSPAYREPTRARDRSRPDILEQAGTCEQVPE